MCANTIFIERYSSCLGPIRLGDGSHKSSVLWEHTSITVPRELCVVGTHFHHYCVRSRLAGRDVAGGVTKAKYPTSVCANTIFIGRYSSCLGPNRLGDGSHESSHESSVLWKHTSITAVSDPRLRAEMSLVR